MIDDDDRYFSYKELLKYPSLWILVILSIGSAVWFFMAFHR